MLQLEQLNFRSNINKKLLNFKYINFVTGQKLEK